MLRKRIVMLFLVINLFIHSNVYSKSLSEIKQTHYITNKILEVFNKDYSYIQNISFHIINTSKLLKQKYNLDVKPYEIASIIAIESGFNHKSYNKNTKAKGLMQITPICIKSVEMQTGIRIKNPFSIRENIFVGSYYYAINKKKYGSDMSLVVYNSGYKNSKRRLIVSRGNENSYLRKVRQYFYFFK